MTETPSSVLSFENANGTHLVVTFLRDDSNGLILIDIYGRNGDHDAEKRLTFGAGKMSNNAASIKAAIEKAKQQITRTVEDRHALMDILEGMSKGQV